MLSKNQIGQFALSRLGNSLTVTDFEVENTIQAKLLRQFFQYSLDYLLEKYDWKFCRKKIELTLLEENTELTGRRYKYAFPASAFIIREIASEGFFAADYLYRDQVQNWEEETVGGTRYIYTDVPLAHAKYTLKLDGDSSFPNYFGRALAAQISMDLAPALITNNFTKIQQSFNRDALNEISQALASDIGTQPEIQNSHNPFVRARM